MQIKLEPFKQEHYLDLISWIPNEEMLMQFAGPGFTFPLTFQQLDASLSDPNRISFNVVSKETNTVIGHCEIYVSDNSAKLGRILIGDPGYRGKGLGQQIVQSLLHYTFTQLNKPVAELNVFDWNTGAIKCYEKVGFTINPNKKLERKVNDQTWIAINMTIDRSRYEELQPG